MENLDSNTKRSKRPVFLLVLCILSFLWIGWGILQGAAGFTYGPESPESLETAIAGLDKQLDEMDSQSKEAIGPTVEKIKYMVLVMNDKFYLVQTLSLFIYILGFVAVLQMFRGAKIGFHLYVIYSLLSICDYYFFLSPAMIPTFIIILSAFISALFVSMYAVNLKWMR